MRDNSVSIAKGIAIVLMVMAHSRCPLWLQQFINMFHMPLFFFFSGYCFKESYLYNFNGFAMKRITGVYLPFVKWSLLFLLFHNLFYHINIYNDEYGFRGTVSHLYSIKEFGVHALHIVTNLSDNDQLLGGYWFLHSFFWGSFIFYATVRLFTKLSMGGAFLIILCLVFLSVNFSVPYFEIGARELFGAFFMIIGYHYQKTGMMNRVIKKGIYVFPLLLILVILGTKYWQCGMLSLTFFKVLPYSTSALSGTLMIFMISRTIMKGKIVKELMVFIGNHTLDVLTWHFISFKLVSLLIIIVYSIPTSRLAEFPVIEEYAYMGWWLVYLFIGIIIPCVCVIGFNHVKSWIQTCYYGINY